MSEQQNILIVEDNKVVSDSLARVLGVNDLKYDQVFGFEEALQRIVEDDYDLAMLDLMLDKHSGLDLALEISKVKPMTSIVLMTGFATLENAILSYNKGLFDFLAKPFTNKELLGVVSRGLLYAKRRRKALAMPFQFPSHDIKGVKLGDHSWLSLVDSGLGSVGPGASFGDILLDYQEIELPQENSSIDQLGVCVKFIANNKYVHLLRSPVGGKIYEVNDLYRDPENLKKGFSDFRDLWLYRLTPTNLEQELENLKEKNI